VFLGETDTSRIALYLNFGRGLADNRFKRAERAFTGYLFNGEKWLVLTYTQAAHLEPRLDQVGDHYFYKFTWNEDHTGGRISYDRRSVQFELEFAELEPVQAVGGGVAKRRVHAIGAGTLTYGSSSIAGPVFYELVQLEGFNPIVDHWQGVDFSNFDWLALTGETGERIIASADSAAPGEHLYKNFLAYVDGDSTRYADGAANVRVISDQIRRDPKITEFLALQKSVVVDELGFRLDLELTDDRFFYTSGFCMAIVEGEVTSSGRNREVWGILEHIQKPQSARESLR
jgi:hypothetical protein